MKIYNLILAALVFSACSEKPGKVEQALPEPIGKEAIHSVVQVDSTAFSIGGDAVTIHLFACEFSENRMQRKGVIMDVAKNGGWHDFAIGYNEAYKRSDSAGMITKVRLSPAEEDVFVVSTYIDGSTFGAQSNYVIWKNDRNEWRITQDPFSHGELEDVNQDGVFEIVSYDAGHTGKPQAYNFRKGMWTPR